MSSRHSRSHSRASEHQSRPAAPAAAAAAARSARTGNIGSPRTGDSAAGAAANGAAKHWGQLLFDGYLKYRWWIKRHFWQVTLGMCAVTVVGMVAGALICAPDVSKFNARSFVLYDRDDNLIFEMMPPDNGDYHRILTAPEDVDPLYLKMLLASEDERFYHHLGVDPFAIVRAVVSNISAGTIVSGASTLAMQVCRMLEPKDRTLSGKVKEALGALYLTHTYDRAGVLTMYLTLAPFGGNIEGVTAASYYYFNHSPKHLTPAEAALLVALPRAPEAIRPDRHLKAARYYRNEVLKKAAADGLIKDDVYKSATAEPIPLPRGRSSLPQSAFHLGQTIFTHPDFLKKAIPAMPHSTATLTALKAAAASASGAVTAAEVSPTAGAAPEDTITVSAAAGTSVKFTAAKDTKAAPDTPVFAANIAESTSEPRSSAAQVRILPSGAGLSGRQLALREVKTTIDPEVQAVLLREVEAYRERLPESAWLEDSESVAVLALDNETFEVLGYVGSIDPTVNYVDAVQAPRSPGSALKPFAYGMAFEQGQLHPHTVLLDIARLYRTYQPRNYDRSFHGEITAAYALQGSLNLPALEIMRAVGPENFVGRLNTFTSASTPLSYAHNRIMLPPYAEPSLGIVLGGCSTTLYDLTQLYAALANNGKMQPLTVLAPLTEDSGSKDTSVPRKTGNTRDTSRPSKQAGMTILAAPTAQYGSDKRLMSAEAARAVYHILEGTPAPRGFAASITEQHKISYKTGTSYKYRDTWSVGSRGRLTVGIWMGRTDGSPSTSYSAVEKTAPMLFSILSQLDPKEREKEVLPPHVLLQDQPPAALTQITITELGRVRKHDPKNTSNAADTLQLRLDYPIDGSRMSVGSSGLVLVKYSGGKKPYYLLVNDELQEQSTSFRPQHNGFHHVTIIDGTGSSVSAQLLIQGVATKPVPAPAPEPAPAPAPASSNNGANTITNTDNSNSSVNASSRELH